MSDGPNWPMFLGVGSLVAVGWMTWQNSRKDPGPLAPMIKPLDRASEQARTIFTAGSIEMGKAIDWQSRFQEDVQGLQQIRRGDGLRVFPITVVNPRRDDWNNEWNSRKFHPSLVEQINWELDHLEGADVIVFCFDPNTMSPISLLELGLFARSNKVIVYCPEEYFRVENVATVCSRYKIPFVNSLSELAERAVAKIYEE